MGEWHDFLNENLSKNPELKKEYDDLEDEYNLIQALIQFRIDNGLTQQQLAERAGIKQPNLARIESGSTKPGFITLKKLAHAMGKKISFV